jgi:uncharacterized protein YwgA
MATSAEDAVLSVVAASPNHQVHGKKRIQKIMYLCMYGDEPIDARFHIRHFGVFSPEIADALEFLSVFGDLTTRDEQVGPNRYFTTVFELRGKSKHRPNERIAQIAELLGSYSTPSLEVASTVAYFMREDGLPEAEAIKETKKIKPGISTPDRISTTKTLLKRLAALRATDHGQRSTNP